jgi:hypothetical protein
MMNNKQNKYVARKEVEEEVGEERLKRKGKEQNENREKDRMRKNNSKEKQIQNR